jgi:transcription antitermination factor NusB
VSARTKSRKRALDILYGADVRGVALAELLGEEAERAEQQPERASSWPYARELVEGVDAHLESIDQAIEAHAQGWTLARMPALDRAIARLATWEILHNDAVPDGVAIAEAVDFATTLSTDDSPGFLNGVLGAISRSKGA